MKKFGNYDISAKKFFSGITGVNEAPSWLPKANFSRSQADLIARNESGEEVIFVDYFTNFDLPSISSKAEHIFDCKFNSKSLTFSRDCNGGSLNMYFSL